MEQKKDWIKVVVAGNRLRDIQDWMKAEGETIYHCDRHVADEVPESFADGDRITVACVAGLALLEAWSEERSHLGGLRSTKPVLIVGEEWLAAEEMAPPPHVKISLARQERDLPAPDQHTQQSPGLPPVIEGLIKASPRSLRVSYLKPEDRDLAGAWLLEIV